MDLDARNCMAHVPLDEMSEPAAKRVCSAVTSVFKRIAVEGNIGEPVRLYVTHLVCYVSERCGGWFARWRANICTRRSKLISGVSGCTLYWQLPCDCFPRLLVIITSFSMVTGLCTSFRHQPHAYREVAALCMCGLKGPRSSRGLLQLCINVHF